MVRHSGGNVAAVVGFALLLAVISHHTCSSAQYFDAKVDDQEYLDKIQKEVSKEVEEARAELMEEAKIIQQITKNYIAAKLKQNLFKALRVLAEKELAIDVMTMADRPRQPRQGEEEETESGGAGGSAGGSEEESSDSSTRRPSQILPQVANLIKAVFGGNINLTSYVEQAATFLPKPVGNQLVGVVKLLANNPGHKYTTTTTVGTTPATTVSALSANETTKRQRATKVTTVLPDTTPATAPPTTAGQSEDEDEDSDDSIALDAKNQRQLQLPGLEAIGNIGGLLINNIRNVNNNNNNNAASNNAPAQNKNSTSNGEDVFNGNSGSSTSNTNDMGNKMQGIDVGSLAKEVRNGLTDLIKIMPDLFRGAREAFSLLTAVTRLFSSLGN